MTHLRKNNLKIWDEWGTAPFYKQSDNRYLGIFIIYYKRCAQNQMIILVFHQKCSLNVVSGKFWKCFIYNSPILWGLMRFDVLQCNWLQLFRIVTKFCLYIISRQRKYILHTFRKIYRYRALIKISPRNNFILFLCGCAIYWKNIKDNF